jgi:GNAT superfamily N-acetyltransferase
MKAPVIFLSTQVENGIQKASAVMREVAGWFRDRNLSLWSEEELSVDNLLKKYQSSEIYVGLMRDEPCLAFVLQWQDPVFWPDDAPGEAGYVHKLSVAREYRGTGLAALALEWCKDFARTKGRSYLRLDCDPTRPGLVDLYERCGFTRVGRRMMGAYDAAFYECALARTAGAA